MNGKTATIQAPKWITEITSTPQKYVRDIFASLAFYKMKEYEKQVNVFEKKYKTSFEKFEKKVKALKKENFELWDDYLVWKGLYLAHLKWAKRYQKV